MNKSLLLTFILIIIFILNGCQSKEAIKIGFAGGFTGNNSAVAISGRDAVQMAIDEINANGGLLNKEVILVSKDDNSDPEQTKKIDREFINEQVPVVIGHMMSGVAPSMIEAIKDENILMIAPSISTHTLVDIDDNFMRTTLTNKDQGSFLSNHIKTIDKKSKLMVLYSDTNKTFVDGMRPAVVDTFKDLGGDVVIEMEIKEKNTTQMETAINLASEKTVDSVVLIMNAGDVAMFAQLLAKKSLSISMYSGTWGMTAEVIKLGGQAVEGIIFPSQFDPHNTNPKYIKFKEKYVKIFGQIPDFGSIYSYDTAQVIFEAIKKSKSTDPSKIKQAIIEIKNFSGLQQDFIINEYGDCICNHFTFSILHGEFVNIDSIN